MPRRPESDLPINSSFAFGCDSDAAMNITEDELDKAPGAAQASLRFVTDLTDIMRAELRAFWDLMARDVYQEGKYEQIQDEV